MQRPSAPSLMFRTAQMGADLQEGKVRIITPENTVLADLVFLAVGGGSAFAAR